jgi:outer membrane lipoprotein carrier protein
VPKKIQDSTFKKVTISFDDSVLSKMHILDNLEHRTEIDFNQLERNKEINEGSFLFNVPEDVDVIKN